MSEIHFKVETLPDGGFLAHAIGADIFTEGDNLSVLQERVRDAVRCHFEAGAEPALIRLIFESDGPEDDRRATSADFLKKKF